MALDDDDKKIIQDLIAATLEPAINKAVQGASASTLARVKDLMAKVAPPAIDDEEKPAKKPAKETDELKAIRAEMEIVKAEAMKDRERANAGELERVVGENLSKHNVAPALRQAAAAWLMAEKRIVRDESGALQWRSGDPITPYLPVEEGMAKWAAKDGVAFLAPRPAAGSGAPGGSQRPGQQQPGTKISDEQANSAIAEMIGG